MTTPSPSRRAVLLGLPAAALTAAGCEGGSRAGTGPFTADEERSLATLKVVDADHPLLSMTLYTAYDATKPVALPRPPAKPWGCSLFLAGRGPRGPLFGRNFDWDPHAALLLTAHPPKGPASMSMVDISYLGIDRAAAARAPQDEAVRRKLLDAVKLPFDGMNEHGLAVGMAAVPSGAPPKLPGRPVVGSARIQRLVLDQARTVDEAVAVFNRYTVEFDQGEPPLHYLLSDARGKAAAIEFVDGRVQVIPGAGDWHDMVNFILAGTDERRRQSDHRYRAIADRMRATGGRLDPDGAMDLLKRVGQEHTRWSAVYELRHRTLHLSLNRDFGRRRTFRFDR